MGKRLIAAILICLMLPTAIAEEVVGIESIEVSPASTPSANEIAGGREFNDEDMDFEEFEEGGYESRHKKVTVLERSTSQFDNILNPSGIPDNGLPVPFAFQFNYRTPFCRVGGRERSVASSGCGAVCASMIIAYMTENMEQTPYTLMRRAAEEGNYNGNGLTYDVIQGLLAAYRVESEQMPADAETITEQMKAGHPAVLWVGPGTFTKRGHYILLRGLDDEGKVCVTDPNNVFRSMLSYEPELLEKECKGRPRMMLVATGERKTAEQIATEIAAEGETARLAEPVTAEPTEKPEAKTTPGPTEKPTAEPTKAPSPTPEPTATPEPTPAPEVIEVRVCNFKSVNLRASPNKKSRIVGTAKKGNRLDIVEVTDEQSDGYRWYGVLQGGMVKYIREDLTDPAK